VEIELFGIQGFIPPTTYWANTPPYRKFLCSIKPMHHELVEIFVFQGHLPPQKSHFLQIFSILNVESWVGIVGQ